MAKLKTFSWPIKTTTLSQWWQQFWSEMIIIFLWLMILAGNLLTPSVWIMGYDNMMPELNLSLAWERSFFSIWQDYRGLGVVNSVMDAAEITRLPWVALIKFIFGARPVRFIWSLSMILLGALATNALAKQLFQLIFMEKKGLSDFTIKVAALMTSIFYLFNPAMIQFFYTPLETFSSFYGFLPLIIWAFITYVRDSTWKKLLRLFIIAFLASSAFYVQTFFVVLLIILAIYAFGFLFRLAKLPNLKRKALVLQNHWHIYSLRITVGIITVIMANAFWFTPLIFTTIKNSNDVFNSKQNIVSTPQVQEMNQTYGKFKQIVLLYGYWFEFKEYNYAHDNYLPYLGDWHDYWEKSLVKLAGYFIFILTLSGYIMSFFLIKNKKFLIGTLGVFIISILMLTAGEGLILGSFFRLLSRINFFQQMFRVSFTKWSTVVSLSYGLGLGLFLICSSLLIPKLKKIRQGIILSILLLLSSIIISRVSLIFSGHLFGWQVKATLPPTYQELANFMKTLDHHVTVAYLPMPNYWGWLFYNWGYRGSGFLWQMIPQPMLDRNFDVWSLSNQTAYQQLNLAIERNDARLLENVIKKYQLAYFIFDENIIYTNINNHLIKSRASNEIQALLTSVGAKMIWRQENIKVYDLHYLVNDEVINLKHHYQNIYGDDFQGLKDSIYQLTGPYLASTQEDQDVIYYPFAQEYQEEITNINCSTNQCELKEQKKLKPVVDAHSQLLLPQFKKGETYLASGTMHFLNEREIEIAFEPQLQLLIGGDLYNIPKLNNLILDEINSSNSRVIIDFGDRKPYLVELNKFTDFAVEMQVGENLNLKLIDASQLETIEHHLAISNDKVKNYYFPATIWQKVMTPPSINLNQHDKISAIWTATSFRLDFQEKTGISNCDVSERGQVSKQVMTHNALYRAEGWGTLCEHYSLANLSSLNDYLVHFKVQHYQGHPLQFYVTDALTKRLVIDQVLNKNLSEQYFYLPRLKILDNQQHNLFFHLANKSYGKTSQNLINQIRLIQYPIDYLSQIKVIQAKTNEDLKFKSDEIPLYQIKSWTRDNFASYTVEINSPNIDNSAPVSTPPILILNRAYDQWWRASAKTSDGHLVKLEHRLYNGWANAWLIPSDLTIEEIKIEFWPQKLLYWGFGLAGVYFLAIIYFGQKTKKHKRSLHLSEILK